MLKKTFWVALGIAMAAASARAQEGAGRQADGSGAKQEVTAPGLAPVSPAPAPAPAATAEELVVLDTTKGRIVIRLFDADAPQHCKSFRALAKRGFYDGTYFHRLVDGFVIQGGDPNTKDDDEMNDGMGNPGYTVKNEAGRQKHKRGRVAAARGQDLDSAGCQFYICLQDLPQLDAMQYTVFGEVVEGMDVVDRIQNVPKKRQRPESREVSYPVQKTYITKAFMISSDEIQGEKRSPGGP